VESEEERTINRKAINAAPNTLSFRCGGECIHKCTLVIYGTIFSKFMRRNTVVNIIEAVWDHLDRERKKRQPTSKEELWDVLQEAWRTIPEDYLKK